MIFLPNHISICVGPHTWNFGWISLHVVAGNREHWSGKGENIGMRKLCRNEFQKRVDLAAGEDVVKQADLVKEKTDESLGASPALETQLPVARFAQSTTSVAITQGLGQAWYCIMQKSKNASFSASRATSLTVRFVRTAIVRL